MRVLIEGWDSGEPVRALLDAPDASQVRAAERVTLQFDDVASTSGSGNDAGGGETEAPTPLRLLLAQQPHLLARSPPLLSSVVWDCGLALAEWLVEREAAPRRRRGGGGAATAAAAAAAAGADAEEEQDGTNSTVVELGAGAGAPGLAAAASGLAKAVLLTDVAEALRGLRANVTRNRLGGKVAVAELDWSRNSSSSELDVPSSSSSSSSSPPGLLFFGPGSQPPDLILSADVCYPPPPNSNTTGEDATAAAEASAAAWAEAAASLCGPRTRVLVAFEARPGGVPAPEVLRDFLLREARGRFDRVERLDASGMAFAGAANLELYEVAECKK